MKKYFSTFALVLLFVGMPLLAFAQATISLAIPGMSGLSPTSTPPGQWVSKIYNFALMIGGVLAFGAVVYGGILYAASGGNPSKQSEGREWITSALLGILLLGGAYLILYTVNPDLVNLNLPSLQGVNIQAPQTPSGPYTLPTGLPPCTQYSINPGVDCDLLATAITSQVSSAATAYYGASTAAGPGGGTVSCAWAVNNVLTNAGEAPLDTNSVQSMENAINAGRGTLVDPSQATAGDIVIQAQDGHVGICMNDGCTVVLSNSSSNASFTWKSNTSFSPSYSGGPGRIYKLNN